MGQGAHTGLAMLVAEELECDWAKVSTEFVSPQENMRRDRVWGDMSTGASRSIASSQLYLRQAGATAREMLIAAAAARWNVPASECVAAMSVITHRPSGRKLDVRRRCRGGGESAAARRCEAQGSARLEARRQAAPAPRCARQGHRPADLCDRRAAAGHALCGDRRIARSSAARRNRSTTARLPT